jgi:acetolactate synthase-1/3 small subunit
VSARTYTLEITGNEEKVRAFLALVKPLGIKELVRTGPVAMVRGDKVMKPKEKHTKGGEDDESVL